MGIRSGNLPRLEAYYRAYWDFVAGDRLKPRPDTNTKISLNDLLKQNGFSDAEFEKLRESGSNH